MYSSSYLVYMIKVYSHTQLSIYLKLYRIPMNILTTILARDLVTFKTLTIVYANHSED